ncbi:Transposon tx1 putative protein [Thalictrum thalictroides]|uniref:Reverse transcriptase n=1 Tax=Thalictrum thalictroides TaxID=46969 RepID=A0A7J6X258_THATH|nr:Transposon tx1 putative protein [Thalictrum thalictroides]
MLDKKEEVEELEDHEIMERVLLRAELDKLVRQKEIKWQQKAKIRWRVEGENMTKFYHRVVNIRRKSNHLQNLLIEGEEESGEDKIKERIIKFYTDLFHDDGETRPELDGLEIGSISQQQSEFLERHNTEEEVFSTLKKMNGEKSPGPDGIPMKVY